MRATTLLALIGFTALSACKNAEVSVSGAAMLSSLTGDLGLDVAGGSSLSSRKLDTEDLGIDEHEISPTARIDVASEGGLRYGVMGMYHSTDAGAHQLNRDFGVISQGTSVSTDTTFLNFRGYAGYDVVDNRIWTITPAVMLNVIYYDHEVRPTVPGPVVLEEVTHELYAPMPAILAEADLGRFGAMLELGGMNADFGDAKGTIIDADARIRATLSRQADLILGVRYLHMDVIGNADGAPYDSDGAVVSYYLGGRYTF